MAFNGKIPMFYTPHGYSFLMENYKPMKRRVFKLIESVCAKRIVRPSVVAWVSMKKP
ncbi:MAG: hypothetical protein ACLTF6_13440 [Clostridium sp.]